MDRSEALRAAIPVGTRITPRPAQIRDCAANALGSHFGCLTMKRCCGYGCWTLAGGSGRAMIGAIHAQVSRPFRLRCPSARFHCQVT
jgi:hypothetical protein